MSTLTSRAPRTLRRVRRWRPTITWGSARWQWGLAAAIAAVIFWPQSSVDPVAGPDASWQAGLALARMHNLAWGPELVYTYGPLGFLQNTPYYSLGQSLLATIYQPIVVVALFLGIAKALRQRHAPMASLIGAFATTSIVVLLLIGHNWGVPGLEYAESSVLASFAWAAVPLLQQSPKRSMVVTTCVALGAAAGFQMLVKFTGIAIVIIALAVSVLVDWKALGRHCATVGAFAASALMWWVLAGQSLGNLAAWLRYSSDLVSGYSTAMGLPLSLGVLPVLAGLGALCAIFFLGRREIPLRFMALVGVAGVLTAKTAFARLSLLHCYPLLGFIVVTVAITPLSRTLRRIFVVLVAALLIIELGASTAGALAFDYPDRTVAAVQAPIQAIDRLVTLALPGHVDQRVKQAKARLRALYAIPDHFVKAIGSGTVEIDPTETAAVWAYDFAWRPVPVFQTHQAYTPTTDNLNSETLTAGPQFVLSRRSPASPATGSIDGRLEVQQSPRYSRALLCNYAVSGVENRWALFTRSGSHCGPLTALSDVRVRENDVIPVPAPSRPGMAVLVGIDLYPTVFDRLFQGALVPLTIPTLVLDGCTYRLIAANAAEPFLVNTPASVAGTNLEVHAHTIGVGRAPSFGRGAVAARLRFYEMRVDP